MIEYVRVEPQKVKSIQWNGDNVKEVYNFVSRYIKRGHLLGIYKVRDTSTLFKDGVQDKIHKEAIQIEFRDSIHLLSIDDFAIIDESGEFSKSSEGQFLSNYKELSNG